MIPEHLRKRNIAATIYLGGMVAAACLNYKGKHAFAESLVFPIFVSFVAACWYYLKAKKRSGGWLLLLPLSLIALLIYWNMDDCSEDPENIPCSKCGAANFPNDLSCRLCKSSMEPAEVPISI